MQTTGDRADFPIGTAVSGRSTADSSGINGPFTEYDALMRERDALVYHRQMLKRKRTELEQSLQRQRSKKEVCPALFVFPSAEALLKATQSDRVQSTFITHGTAHQCVHNSAALSSWSTPIGSGVGATGLTEYQKLFHTRYLKRTLLQAEIIHLSSKNQAAVISALTSTHLDPMRRRLDVDVPEFSEAMVHAILKFETKWQLANSAIPLNDVQHRMKIFLILESLRLLDLSHTTVTNEDLSGLQGICNLVELYLNFCRCLTDISPIAHIKTLEVVQLCGLKVLRGVQELGKLPRLKEIYLRKTAITDLDLRKLSECRTLEKISLYSCTSLTNVTPLSSITTLEEIDLSGCTSLTHAGALRKLPVLKVLDLSETSIRDVDVRQLVESHTLVKIYLRRCAALTNVSPIFSISTLVVIDFASVVSITHRIDLRKVRDMKKVKRCTLTIKQHIRQMSESFQLETTYLNSCERLTHVNPLSSISTLEVINTSGCTSLTHVDALGTLPVLKEVNWSGTFITDEDVRLLSKYHKLEKIYLSSCKVLTNVNLLSSIATLEIINLSGCTSLTHVGELGKLPALKELNLSYTRITDEEVRLLSESNTLVEIDLQSCEALTNVNPLSSIATLEVIDLSRCTSLTHVGDLGKLPVLKGVGLGFTRITDEEIRLLSECPTLVRIALNDCKALTNVSSLLSIAKLEEISLSYCTSLTHLGDLGTWSVLKKIDFSGTPITDEDVRQLSECRTLVEIGLRMCDELTNVTPLSSIDTLEVINLSDCASLIRVGELGKWPVLKGVNLGFSHITDEDVCQLSECRTLVEIHLKGCERLSSVNPLSSIETLKKINLSECTSLTHVGELGKLPVLKELNLSYTRITDEDVRQLSECRTLVEIYLKGCESLTNVNPLYSIETLVEINLSYCTSLIHVGDLGKLPVLKGVDLSYTRITDEEVRQLSECRTLVEIYLKGCESLTNVNPLSSILTVEKITVSCCTSLTYLGELGKLPVLKELDLSSTGITDYDVCSMISLRRRLALPFIDIKR